MAVMFGLRDVPRVTPTKMQAEVIGVAFRESSFRERQPPLVGTPSPLLAPFLLPRMQVSSVLLTQR